MLNSLSIRPIITAALISIVPIVLLPAVGLLWSILFGGYNETFMGIAWTIAMATIVGAPFVAGYIAARKATALPYIHGVASVLITWVAALFTDLNIAFGESLRMLSTVLPESISLLIPVPVILRYVGNTFLFFILLILFCTFGTAGVVAALKLKQ